MNDPANLPFMQAIMRGQLPPELDPGDPNVQVGSSQGRGLGPGPCVWCAGALVPAGARVGSVQCAAAGADGSPGSPGLVQLPLP